MATSPRKKIANAKTSACDVAEHLHEPQNRWEMAACLDAWLEEVPDDVSGIARALGDIARAKAMSQVAKEAGLSRESLYRALSADGNPSFATVVKVARALGARLHAQHAEAPTIDVEPLARADPLPRVPPGRSGTSLSLSRRPPVATCLRGQLGSNVRPRSPCASLS